LPRVGVASLANVDKPNADRIGWISVKVPHTDEPVAVEVGREEHPSAPICRPPPALSGLQEHAAGSDAAASLQLGFAYFDTIARENIEDFVE